MKDGVTASMASQGRLSEDLGPPILPSTSAASTDIPMSGGAMSGGGHRALNRTRSASIEKSTEKSHVEKRPSLESREDSFGKQKSS